MEKGTGLSRLITTGTAPRSGGIPVQTGSNGRRKRAMRKNRLIDLWMMANEDYDSDDEW